MGSALHIGQLSKDGLQVNGECAILLNHISKSLFYLGFPSKNQIIEKYINVLVSKAHDTKALLCSPSLFVSHVKG